MTITINEQPVIVEFVSCNHGVTLYRRADTKISDGFLYNAYSHSIWFNGPKFHKKLKIYHHEVHGDYVNIQRIRCYMNGFEKELKK